LLPENNARLIPNLLEKSRRYSQVKVHHHCPPVSMTPVAVHTTPAANFPTGTAGVVDTGVKFATCVNDNGGKFAAGVNDTSDELPPVTLTLAANLSLVSTTPVAKDWYNIKLLTPSSELEEKTLSIC
jgi:hypothetical protein